MLRRLPSAFIVTLLVSPVYAQSLGEAAAREKAKRDKQGPSATRVITDQDLKASRPPPKPGQGTESGDAASRSGRGGSGSEEGGTAHRSSGVREGESTSSQDDEKFWRQRAQNQRKAIAAAEKSIESSQDRMARLMADREPVALSDPNRLQTIENLKRETQQALERAQRDLAAAQKGLQDLEEEARRKSVPPGWLR